MVKRFFGFFFLLCSLSTLADQTPPKILVLGDSLSAAFGIEQDAGWVALLQQRLLKQGYNYEVINASISGETTAGGLARLDTLLTRHRPHILILALGANDGLRGTKLQLMRDNLSLMIQKTSTNNIAILLVGMRLPPNYGPLYAKEFHHVFEVIAKQYDIPLVPFLLHGLGEDTRLFQTDTFHPNAEAQPILLNNVWPALTKEMEKIFPREPLINFTE